MGSILLRVFLSSWRLLLAMILGLAAFIYTAFKLPGVMNGLNGYARAFVDWIFELGVDDKYTVWLNIVSVDDKLVFMMFVIASRFAIAILWGLLVSYPVELFQRIRSH